MAISDKERRRAVAELREASTGAYRHVDALDVIAGSVGVEVAGQFGHEVEKETYAALADLICPTCRNVGPHDYFCCSRCKFEHPIAAKCSTDDCGRPVVETLHFNYCPNCGAEVVNDA